jgi:hypothetical protein
MKIIATAAAVIAVVSFSPAIATDFTLKVQPVGVQKTRWENGLQLIDDAGPTTAVRLMPTKGVVSKRASFTLFALNRSGNTFDLGPENIVLLMEDGSAVRMLNYDDLTREERRKQGWQNVGLAFTVIARSMAAANAGNSYATANYSGSTMGHVGSTSFGAQSFGTATIHSYDAGAAAAAGAEAAEENRRDIEDLAKTQALRMAAINNVMQTTTVDPGAAFGGIVYFDLPPAVRASKDPVPVTLIVRVGGEEHRFRASVQRAGSAPMITPPDVRLAQADKTGDPAKIGDATPMLRNASLVTAPAPKSSAAIQAGLPPVYGGDIDRPYRVLGPVSVVLKKDAVFYGAPITIERAHAALWQKANGLHADAVIHAALAKPHATLTHYQEAEATGVAVAYTEVPASRQQ